MRVRCKFCVDFLTFIIAALFVVGCTKNVSGGNPASFLSSSNGVERVFTTNELAMINAISNAFPFTDYRGMMLTPAPDSAYLVEGWHPTNGFVLFPLMGPITNILLNTGSVVPYRPSFYISLSSSQSKQTRIIVNTIKATIVDGQETGIHGGWANHEREVPGVIQEEQNVLDAISTECKKEGISSVTNDSTK